MIILESKDQISLDKISHLTECVSWGKRYYQSEEKLQEVLAASKHVAYINEGDKMIAFGRILSDGIMCMFYDICVHPDYQGKKVGTLLMEHLLNKVKDDNYVSIGLFTWEGNKTVSEFYSKLGFTHSSAMEFKKYMKKV